MNIESLLAIAIVGGFASVVIDVIKARFGTASNITKLITLGMSFGIGIIWVWIQSTPYIETVLLTLGSASTVYAFFLKKGSTD